MVDTADSKSADRKVMPVRVRPPLPELFERVCRFSANPFLVNGKCKPRSDRFRTDFLDTVNV